MSRMFSLISVHGIENGVARLSQQHYRMSTDDEGINYKTDDHRRTATINVHPDETRKTLDQRLNKQETWIINMGGTLEKAERQVVVTDDYNDMLDD